MTLTAREEIQYAIRLTKHDGSFRYETHVADGYGTRHPIRSEQEARSVAAMFTESSNPTVVTQRVIVIEDGWQMIPNPVHERWVNIDYDDKGGIRGYDVDRCSCVAPWKHKP